MTYVLERTSYGGEKNRQKVFFDETSGIRTNSVQRNERTFPTLSLQVSRYRSYSGELAESYSLSRTAV